MKRIISILLVVIMALGICACSNDTANDGEIPTLVWYVTGDSQPDQKAVLDAFNEKLVERLGAKLDLRFISDGAFAEKMRMMMAAREEFDLCFTGYNNVYSTAVDNGALYDITDLLKETTLPEVLPETLLKIATIDGKIYGIPNNQIMVLPNCICVNKELAEKYNLDMSNFTKTEDIEPFLKLIKEKEPDYIPFSAYYKLGSIHSLDEEVYTSVQGVQFKQVAENDWEPVDAEVFLTKESNTYHQMKVMNDWYKKGYIRKDVDIVGDENAEMAAGKYAVLVTGYKPGGESEFKTRFGFDVVTKIIQPGSYNPETALQTMISVSATTKHPELCVKFIELMNTDEELYNMLCYGIEGKHYNKVGKNRVEIIADSGYEPNAAWKFGNVFNSWLLPEQPDDCHEQSKLLNETAKVIGIPGFTFDRDPVKIEITQLATIQDKYIGLQWGSTDPDTVWDTYVAERERAGVQKIYDEVVRQVEEYEKTLK